MPFNDFFLHYVFSGVNLLGHLIDRYVVFQEIAMASCRQPQRRSMQHRQSSQIARIRELCNQLATLVGVAKRQQKVCQQAEASRR